MVAGPSPRKALTQFGLRWCWLPLGLRASVLVVWPPRVRLPPPLGAMRRGVGAPPGPQLDIDADGNVAATGGPDGMIPVNMVTRPHLPGKR